jgi:hypothetical protein
MGFGLMTGFIGLFDTACDYTSQSTITHTRTLLSTVTPSLPLLDRQSDKVSAFLKLKSRLFLIRLEIDILCLVIVSALFGLEFVKT